MAIFLTPTVHSAASSTWLDGNKKKKKQRQSSCARNERCNNCLWMLPPTGQRSVFPLWHHKMHVYSSTYSLKKVKEQNDWEFLWRQKFTDNSADSAKKWKNKNNNNNNKPASEVRRCLTVSEQHFLTFSKDLLYKQLNKTLFSILSAGNVFYNTGSNCEFLQLLCSITPCALEYAQTSHR